MAESTGFMTAAELLAMRLILIFRSQQQPELLTGEIFYLFYLTGVELTLTVAQVFSWLQMGGK
jgi:Uma2 family endonuclease